MRLLTLLALLLTAAGASADTITRVTRERIRVDRAPRIVVQQAPPLIVQQAPPIVVQQAPPLILQQAPRVYAPAPALAPGCAGGACLSPSQAAALRSAQLRALGY